MAHWNPALSPAERSRECLPATNRTKSRRPRNLAERPCAHPVPTTRQSSASCGRLERLWDLPLDGSRPQTPIDQTRAQRHFRRNLTRRDEHTDIPSNQSEEENSRNILHYTDTTVPSQTIARTRPVHLWKTS